MLWREALSKNRPEIFNTDQGAQFTSESFTGLLQQHEVKISMDGKGSYNDNLFTERPHQALGYLTPAEVFTSTPVEAASGGMIESLTSDSLRIAEPNLNVALVLS